jgi:hypothetical protein
MPTTSWATFAIETQGKIAYNSTDKKGIVIELSILREFAVSIGLAA